MTAFRFALAGVAALALAGTAQAQDFQPKEKGTLMLNTRITSVAPDQKDPIVTAAGAATGLNAEVGDDVMPTIGLSYFLTDNVAVEVIAGTTKHDVKAKGGATDVLVHQTVRRQDIWRRWGRKLAESGPRLWVDVRRRACGAASVDIRGSVA